VKFEDAFARLIGHEGGLSMRREDRGNWTGGKIGEGELKGTKYGILQIYRTRYWAPAGCDMVPEQIKFPLFDLAVNSGPGRAARLLQRAVGAEEDGSVGPMTVMSILNMPPDKVLRRLDAHRLLLMANDPAWPTYGRSWVIRVATNALEAS
jgi:lysozyme family protein